MLAISNMKKYSMNWLIARYGKVELSPAHDNASYYLSSRDKIFYLTNSDYDVFGYLDRNILKLKEQGYRIVVLGGGGDILCAVRICAMLKSLYLPVHVEKAYSAGCIYAFLYQATYTDTLLLSTHGRGDMRQTSDLLSVINENQKWMMGFTRYFVPEYVQFIDWMTQELISLTKAATVPMPDLTEMWFHRRAVEFAPTRVGRDYPEGGWDVL